MEYQEWLKKLSELLQSGPDNLKVWVYSQCEVSDTTLATRVAGGWVTSYELLGMLHHSMNSIIGQIEKTELMPDVITKQVIVKEKNK